MYYLLNRLTRSWILIARCPEPAVKLFKFGVVTCGNAFLGVAPWDASGGVEDTSFDKICCDSGVNFELAKSIAFCPALCLALREMFKAVSTTCFLLMNPEKSLWALKKFQSSRLGIFFDASSHNYNLFNVSIKFLWASRDKLFCIKRSSQMLTISFRRPVFPACFEAINNSKRSHKEFGSLGRKPLPCFFSVDVSLCALVLSHISPKLV